MKKSLLKHFMSALMIMLATVTASAQCYILGNDGNWQTDKASAELQKTDIDGVYEGEVTFAPNAKYFGIVTKLTEEPDDWLGLLEYRYGPAKADQLLSYNNPEAMVFQKDASFQVPGEGTYRLRVDFNAMTVTMLGTYPSSLYVLGSKGNFEPTIGEEPLPMTETEGVYKATIEFTNTIFSIISSEYSASQINSFGGGKVIINRDKNIERSESYFSITKPGTYDVTVDLRNMTMKLYSETYVPDYPDHVYFLGTDGRKVANDGVKLTWEEEEGVYTGWVYFESNKFYISSALASTPDGWDEIKDYRIGAPTATCNVEPNLTVGVEKGVDSEFLIEFPAETSSYACVTLDLPNKRMTIYGSDPNYPQGYPKELYVVGSTGKWYTNIPANIIPATDVPGIYEGEITFEGESSFMYFAIFKRLAIDWDTVNATRLTPAKDGDPANINEDIHAEEPAVSPGAWNFTGEPGTYDIRVDLTQGMGVIRISEKAETGIVAPNFKTPAKSYYYDLNGRFLGNVEPQKGIYVVKGKKVIK